MQQHSVQLDTITPQRGPQHHELGAFLGRWKMSGEYSPTDPSDPTKPLRKATGIETYEWLPGEYFLVNRWARKVGPEEEPDNGIGWIGFDAKLDSYVAHSAASSGMQRLYEVEVENGQLIILGDTERATVVLNEDQSEMIIRWENREKDGEWKFLCHLEGVRLNS
jgi:hypothetical protein